MERRAFIQMMQTLLQFPQAMLSRELLKVVAEMFDVRNNRLVDELNALAMKMVQISAVQAGRTQGGGMAGGDGGAQMPPEVGAALSGVTGGMT